MATTIAAGAAPAVQSTTTATTSTSSSSSSSSSSSLRYTRLVSVLEKALTKSRQHFNVKQAVAQVYGDDANIFGCSSSSTSSSKNKKSASKKTNHDDDEEEEGDQTSNNMLRQVFESMLDRIEEEVSEYMLQDYFVQNDVEEKFLKLEAIIELLRRQEIQRQQAEEADKQSARLAVEAAKRPKYRHAAGSVATTADVIQLSTLQEMQAQRNALLQQVEALEAENCTLQEKKTLRLEAHKAKGSAAHVVQQLALELENSADVGSVFDK